VGDVPGVSEEAFLAAAKAAKEGCPVSKALAATPISLKAELKK
jgi:osmotically inducible protein OsmC